MPFTRPFQEGYTRDANGSLYVNVDGGTVTLATEDVEIGAVEIKDGTTDQRVTVNPDGTLSVSGPLTNAQLRASAVPISGVVGITGEVEIKNDTGNPVPVTGTVNPTTPSVLIGFITAVTTAGTRVQLAANAIVAGIMQAPSTNVGVIYVGAATVSAAVFGAELQPGQSTGIAIDNTNRIFIDASSSGDKCAFLGS